MNKPQLRFKGFEEEWQKAKVEDISTSVSGGTPRAGVKEYYGGEIPFIRSGEIHGNTTELFLTEKGYQESSAQKVSKGVILYALYGATSGEVDICQIDGAINQAILAITPTEGDNAYFLANWLKGNKNNITRTYLQGGQGNLSGAIVKNILLDRPTIAEQQLIGNYFKRIDDMITEVEREISRMEKMKQASLQKMFPRPGETTPEIRFAGFTEPWKFQIFENILGYIQPQPYIVKSSEYEERGIPVLTAGKSFILGYTNESFGIYNKLPAILFDDFTTDKKFVDFPFKVKSSAAKILFLKSEDFDINFIYQMMVNLPFDASNHRRYWISDYSQVNICVPTLKEQKAIGEYFRNLDSLLDSKRRKLSKLRVLKQSCLDKMFVNNTDTSNISNKSKNSNS